MKEWTSMNINISEKSSFICKIAELLRGDYKQSAYGDVVLPFTVLCRLDSVLAPTKDKVLELHKTLKYKNKAPFFRKATGYKFYNTSEFTFAKLKNDSAHIADNLRDYIKGFSDNAREILESFDLYAQIARLDKANLLYLVVSRFVDDIDLHPDKVSNNEMGYIFEDLIRRLRRSRTKRGKNSRFANIGQPHNAAIKSHEVLSHGSGGRYNGGGWKPKWPQFATHHVVNLENLFWFCVPPSNIGGCQKPPKWLK
jgi:type I restriction enzyme M protein